MVIGHTKLKTIKQQGMTEEQEFQVLESNLNSDYANIVAHKADVIATINVEMEVNNESKRVMDTKRYVYFRNNGFVSAGSRFGNIVEKVELSADNFIKAIEDAIRNSMSTPVSEEELKARKEEEMKEKEIKVNEFVEQTKESHYNTSNDELEIKTEKLDKIKANIQRLDMSKVQPIMSKYNVIDFTNIEIIDMKCLDEILELL